MCWPKKIFRQFQLETVNRKIFCDYKNVDERKIEKKKSSLILTSQKMEYSSKLYGVNVTIIIFVFVFYCIFQLALDVVIRNYYIIIFQVFLF